MVNREQVVSKETLLLKVWGNDADAVENNVEVYISFLRKKLEFLKAGYLYCDQQKAGIPDYEEMIKLSSHEQGSCQRMADAILS